AALAAYQSRLLDAQYQAFAQAASERIKLSSTVTTRAAVDLRQEERIAVMRQMMADLQSPTEPNPVLTDVLSRIFDFDDIFYFVAPDWWAPRFAMIPGTVTSLPTPSSTQDLGPNPRPDGTKTLNDWAASWGTTGHSYYITQDSFPAPLGASIGWLLQLDG